MSPRHPIPDAALDDRLGFTGTAGSGKTYNSGGAVERVLDRRGRVVIPDPLGVWWGLRLLADGRSPSPYDVVIFGGPHGDLPITEHAGALVGETVARMAESCILDLSQFGTKAAERRFMLAFLAALYRHASGEPVHVVFDEADMWAPQRLMDRDGDATKLLGQMETIVRRGRVKGFIPWLITQRPAVLSKDVLSQVDGLVAFKLTSSQDRKALGDWIEGQADREQGKAILASLPEMQRGQGIVWVPARGVLTTVSFPEKKTFDSSRTPKRGEKRRTAELKPVNIDALKAKLSTVEAEVKANDPKALKAEIVILKRQMQSASSAAAQQGQIPDPKAIEEAEKRGFVRGVREHQGHLVPMFAQLENAWQAYRLAGEDMTAAVKRVMEAVQVDLGYRAAPARASVPIRAPSSNGHARPPVVPRPRESDSKLARAERLILTALAQYPSGRSKNQVAILTGYAVNGGGFNNAISSLRSAGLLAGSGDRLEATEEGLTALGAYDPLPSGQALLDHWLRQLGKAERAALRTLADAWPHPMLKEDVAAVAGYASDGGGFNNAISRLRTLELVSGRGELKASDDLFDTGHT